MAKRISQLNALSSASLNTTLVGIDNGVTYKITLDVLEDAVINMLSASTDARLDFLETFSSSFNTFSASLDSRLDNVTIDTSSLATKTLLNTFTQSYYSASASFDSRVDSLENATSSYLTSLNGAISSSTQVLNGSGIFSSSAQLPNGLISSSTQLPSNLISGSSQISTLGFITGSYISSSSYTTDSASFNSRIISGSVVAGTISSSAQITALGFISTSTDLTSLNTFTQSIDSRVDSLEAATSSYITSLDGVISSSAQILSGSGIVSGSSQLTTSFPSKTTGNWTVPAGASTQSFSVESGASYTMWVNGNIPNGIITWNATVTTANTNVPVVGSQHGWYYSAGNALVLTSMPDQITGTNGSIVTTPASYAPNTSNVFKFGITNNSGASQTINYGYIKLS